MSKLISVIIPCFNVANLIDRCFASLENQTLNMSDLEILLIDDASTDETWSKIEAFEQRYPESVMAIHCDQNGRQGTARNIGLQYATGEFVTFIDADDWIEKDMIERLLEPMREQDYNFTMCMHSRDDGNDTYGYAQKKVDYQRLLIDSTEKRKTFLLCMSIGSTCWGKLYRRSFLLNNGIFFVENLAYEDHYFMLLLYLFAMKFCILNYVGYHYFVNQNSTVLQINGSHHEDVLAVDEICWMECQRRGVLEVYFEELEYYFMQIAFLGPLRSLVPRFEEPPYEFYCRLRDNLIGRNPNFLDNRYIKEFMTEMNKELLKMATVPISDKEFAVLFNTLKKRR